MRIKINNKIITIWRLYYWARHLLSKKCRFLQLSIKCGLSIMFISRHYRLLQNAFFNKKNFLYSHKIKFWDSKFYFMCYRIQNFKGIYSSFSSVIHCWRRLQKINFVNFLERPIWNFEDYTIFIFKFPFKNLKTKFQMGIY